jgi:hypothetical protein
MPERYLIRHPETELHLAGGIVWVSCQGDALALTRVEVNKWLSLACETKSLEVVPLVLGDRDCCAA